MKILVTGGTGSFGSKLVDRLSSDDNCEMIRVFSRDETKQYDMRQQKNVDKVDFIIGDVRNKDSLRQAVRGVDYIFHAAALKQVPTGELFPQEMIATNIIGTRNLIEAIEESGDKKKTVLLSTDKAVYPVNTMGISKAMAEKLFLATPENRYSEYNVVRYGNVMASRGSVIPLFIDKIKAGEPLPLTDPKMTRFLLSLDDAIDLVMYTLKEGKSGDLFVKKAPAATVQVIADALCEIFDYPKNYNVIGVRGGEKEHETLVSALELKRSEDTDDYIRINPESALSNFDSFYKYGVNTDGLEDYTSANTKQLTLEETIEILHSLDYVKAHLKTR